MKKEIRENQALYSHMLMFDPVNHKFGPPRTAPNPLDPARGATFSFPAAMGGPGAPGGATFEAVPGVRTFDDGSVEVTFYAPDAKTVEIAGAGGSMQGRYAMEPVGDGYWKVLITDLRPGFHYHVYFVDGVMTVHPTLPFGYGSSLVMNYIEIPDPELDFYLLKDVPHGSIHMEIIKSELAGRYRNLWIYTPPGYEKSDKRYPVMYIQHGGGENETGWIWQGKINYIADNLIAEGKCEEMIIVCSSSAAPKELEDGTFTDVGFVNVMVNEIVPFVDDKYRTIADRTHRAMAGLSAGGSMARQIAHGHPELFANLGQFSCGGGFAVGGITTVEGGFALGPNGVLTPNRGGPDYSELFSTPEHYNAWMNVSFITCGTDDPRHKYTEPQVNELIEKGYNFEYVSYPGYHEWDVWRFSARDYMMRLFK